METRRLTITVRHKAVLGFMGAVVALAAVGGMTHWMMNRFVSTTAAVDRAHVVLGRLQTMFSIIVDAESAVRGYVIAGDRSYLEPYVAARAAGAQRLAEIRRLTHDEPEQQRRLRVLGPLVQRRLALIERNIEARRRGGIEGARDMVMTGEGKALTDSIRLVIDAMSREESVLLETRVAEERDLAWRVRIIIALGLVFAFALSTSATLIVRRDIAERTRAEEEMRQAKDVAESASHAKSDFLARMSHELRTPLNSVIGFSGVLLRNKAGNLMPQDRSYLERIQANGKHLLALINDVLDLSRIEAGGLVLERVPVALDALIRETVASFEPQARDREITIRTEMPERLSEIKGDPMRLRQVLVNIIGNAVKFTERGTVVVRVEVEHDTGRPLRVDVTDTGPGIPENRREAVFRTFEQADTSTARRYGGTGLGLAISRSLCEMMGYKLELESEVGRGSTLSIIFRPSARGRSHALVEASVLPRVTTFTPPRASPPFAGPASDPTLEPAGLAGFEVLVIDDDADARLLLSRLVEEFGCRVTAVESAAEGLKAAGDRRPDLILLDLIMSEMSGWDMMKALRADPVLCQTPVVVVSVVAHENRGRVLGAVDMIDKPVTKKDLFAALTRSLASVKGQVLVVDDEPDSRRLLATYLRDMGQLDIRSAANGREALAALEHEVPDLIVLDLIMPEMDGVTFLDAVRRDPRFDRLPVVIVTVKDLTPDELGELRTATGALLRKGDALEHELRRALGDIWSRRTAAHTGSADRRG